MKPGTFSNIFIQIVFAVKYRECVIVPEWEAELFKYITGIIQNKGHKLLAINGMPDHIHIFFNMKPICHLSELVREIKKSSTRFINEKGFLNHKFRWQSGYGAFSYSYSHIGRVINYIKHQKEHHSLVSFEQEYHDELVSQNIDFKREYLFEWIH